MQQFRRDMEIAKYSPVTIGDRIEVVERFRRWLDKPLLEATGEDLRAYQATFSHLAPASVDIYTRHLKAFYQWAHKRRLIAEDPSTDMILPRLPKGLPHPTSHEDLRVIFACTDGPLRLAYVLAAFAGLRRGEICRLHRRDLQLGQREPVALVHGKGGKDRKVPLLAPVVMEIERSGLAHGWVVHLSGGRAYPPERLSADSTHLLRHRLGLSTTLHSMRGTFATSAGRRTRDPMFVRDLLGHSSVATTEIYVQTSMRDAHERLAGVASEAWDMLGMGTQLRAVR